MPAPPRIIRKRNPVRRGVLEFNDRQYYFSKTSKSSHYWSCKEKGCSGRAVQSVDNTDIIRESQAHICSKVCPLRRAKDAAVEKLRELTLTVEGNVKAVDLVRNVLKDLAPEVRALMPCEDSLIHKVRRWARSNNIPLVKATPEDYLIPEGEEPLVGFSGIKADSSSASGDPLGINVTSNEAVKTGIVYMEPVSGLAECEDKDPSGLFYLKGLVNGHHRAVIEGQPYSWRRNWKDGRLLYACREAKHGCPVTVVVDNDNVKYELRGSHVHENQKKERSRKSGFKTLKRVDEDGNEIGGASLEDFISGNIDWPEDFDSSDHQADHKQSTTSLPKASTSYTVQEDDNDNDYMDMDGDDFQMDVEPEVVAEPIQIQPTIMPKIKSPIVINTSSNPSPKKSTKLPPKDAVKSGERCFVCGDELIVSETLGASRETFRKACCYLNVKSDGKWFPRSGNSQFYSFCESCTTEIIRIHSLYKKVEEIQSLIFRKVESVEKRIADAEIVDNWMAEAPHSTALRFEGFRKQVLINYRNKLKLRREIRFGRKIGNPLTEVQPSSSAHMFAKDPSQTENERLCAIVPDSVANNSGYHPNTNPGMSSKATTPPRRTRGRPKSKKPIEEREDLQSEQKPIPISEPDPPVFDDASAAYDNDDDGFQNDFDDSQDAMSVTSEKEVKFWEDDPSKLEVGRKTKRSSRSRKTKDKYATVEDEQEDANEKDFDDDEWENDSDPNYEEDQSDDEDWGSSRKGKKKKPAKTSSKLTEKAIGWPSKQVKVPAGPRKIIFEDKRPRKKAEPVEPKPVKASHSYNIKFPDAVLTKDGRVFMEGIEIIKNQPGAYKLRPYSVSYSCGECGKIMLGFWKMRQHICGHHLGMYKCHVCDKQFSDAKIIKQHITVAHGDAQSQIDDCPICGKPIKTYKKERIMWRHRWGHLSEEEKQDPEYQKWCPPEKNPNKKAAIRSRQSFMCGQCGKTFQLPSALRKHELTHAPGYEAPTIMCQYCGKQFDRRKGLSQHTLRCAAKVKGQVNLTTYPCPKCPTRFSTRGTRSKHMRRFHSNVTNAELPFSCPKCPRSFGTRSGFRNHKRVCVDGEKGYNNKNASTDQAQPSTSSANTGYSEFKSDLHSPDASSSSTTGGQHQVQNSSSAESNNPRYESLSALGFNYHFLGGGNSNY